MMPWYRISDLQQQLEISTSNCSWRVVAKFAVEFRLFWLALKKKIKILKLCSECSMHSGLQKTKGNTEHVNKQPIYSRLDIKLIEGVGKLHWFPWAFAGPRAHIYAWCPLFLGHHYGNNTQFSYRNADVPGKLVSVVQTDLFQSKDTVVAYTW